MPATEDYQFFLKKELYYHLKSQKREETLFHTITKRQKTIQEHFLLNNTLYF